MIRLTQKQYSDIIENWNSQRYKHSQHKKASEECRQEGVHKYAVTPLSNDTSRTLVCTRCMKYVMEYKE